MKAKETAEAGEKVLKDDRFAALVSDHRFARDPTSSHFDPSSATNQRIQDERKSRKAVVLSSIIPSSLLTRRARSMFLTTTISVR